MTEDGSRDSRLYQLLPALYRERDDAEGRALQGLLEVIGKQATQVETNIREFYEDLFIETCRTWVIPYIGDLVSNELLFDSSRVPVPDTARQLFPDLVGPDLLPPPVLRTRADVARTISYRRRKGTLPLLEELARDVTGWAAHAVEFFELLGWTQFREHFRAQSCWLDVRSVDRMDRINGPFDEASRTVDVREIAQEEGRYNIHNIGLFLWRLNSYPISSVTAHPVQGKPWQFHCSPLGNPAPLFSRLRREGDDAGLATELHVPAPIRRSFFASDLDRYRHLTPSRPDFTDLYGQWEKTPASTLGIAEDRSLFIVVNGVPLAPAVDPAAPLANFVAQVVCRRLDPWPAAQPTGRVVEVDVEHGRLAVGDGWGDGTATKLDVSVFYCYGFSADMGGGPYKRDRWLIDQRTLRPESYEVNQSLVADGMHTFNTLPAALARWEASGKPNAVIEITDNRTYELPDVTLRNDGWLAIEAATQVRPLLTTDHQDGMIVNTDAVAAGITSRDAALTLSGVIVEGWISVVGDIRKLRIVHSTLVPGRHLSEQDGTPLTAQPSLVVAPDDGHGARINGQAQIEIAYSITGPIVAPAHAERIWLLDSIVDGLAIEAIGGEGKTAGPPLSIERSTILGPVSTRQLDASEAIFAGPVTAERRQQGCVRCSYVAPGSQTPRRFRCQPDLEEDATLKAAREANHNITQAELDSIRQHIEGWLVPSFTSTRYGTPAYAQLHLHCPVQLRTGAEDGSEMGAFCHLKQPQREGNLRIRLQEYLPFGLDPGVLYVT